MPFSIAQSHKKKLSDMGVVEIIEMKHKNLTNFSTEIRKVKVAFKSNELRDRLLREGLALSFRKYLTELSFKQPSQCFRCFSLDHLIAACPHSTQRCGRCNMEKHDGQCVGGPKCENCKGDHSSLYRKCPVYASAKDAAFHKATIKGPQPQTSAPKEDFTRQHSGANYKGVLIGNNNSSIEGMFSQILAQNASLKQNISSLKDTLNEKIDAIENQCPSRKEVEERLNSKAAENNQTVLSALNAAVGIFHDVFKDYVDENSHENLAKKIFSACRDKMETGKEEANSISFREGATQYFKLTPKRGPSDSHNCSLNGDSSLTIGNISKKPNG